MSLQDFVIDIAHGNAAFLSWHRWFIHLYERALRESCGYTGHLAYDYLVPTTYVWR
jgi:tyrosinase